MEYLGKTPLGNQEDVMNQKYITLYIQPYESWAEYRKIKYLKNSVYLASKSKCLIWVKYTIF
ncbi:MAG: SusD/RagB family nutrient-binding outer membrane lipoprotein [Flavobacteriales bacterium AspAUS03]